MIDWNSRWKDFLIGQGAVMDDSGVRHFAETNDHAQSRLAATGDIIADLSQLALIRVQGPEAAAFLQGQLSNDIRDLDSGRSQLSAHCDPKGRVLALFRIFVLDQAYYLQLPATLMPDTFNRLKMFVLRAKLTLERADQALIRIGLSGPHAERLLVGIVPQPPTRIDETLQHAGITVLRLPGPLPRYELLAEVVTAERVWSALGTQAKTVGASAWSWLDIAAGIPTILQGTAAEFIPQMLNLDLLNGVSFTKGCYPGQEIVARVRHRGRVTHRLVCAHGDIADPPPPGTALYDAHSAQAAGWVVNAEPAPAGGIDLTAVLSDTPPGGALHVGNPQGPLLTLQKPQYITTVS